MRLGGSSRLCRRLAVGPETKRTSAYSSLIRMNASDGFKIALLRLDDELVGTGASIVNHVHDEVVVEVPDDRRDEVKRIVERCMVDGMNEVVDGVRFKVK